MGGGFPAEYFGPICTPNLALGIFIIKSTCVMIFCGATGAHMRRMMERGKQKAHPRRADLAGEAG